MFKTFLKIFFQSLYSQVEAINTPSFAKSKLWVFPYMASNISGNNGLSNLFRFAVLISFIAEKPRSQHALSSGNVKANWKTGTIFSYPPVTSANFSLASMFWYSAEFPSEVMSEQYCMVAFFTSNFGKNFRRAVSFFSASSRLVSLCVKSKFSINPVNQQFEFSLTLRLLECTCA